MFQTKEKILINESKDIVKDDKLDVDEDSLPDENKRPTEGISTYIGQTIDTFQKKFGKPTRIDPSYYGYSWYIYNDEEQYMMVGVLNQSIVSIAVATPNINTSPFEIGENLESVYQKVTMQPEIELKTEEGIYRFELFEDDLNINPLIPLGDIYAQLYFDQFEGNLLFVRFMDERTLVKHRPYDMTYRGELIEAGPVTDTEWSQADEATEKQIFELTNIIRNEFSLNELTWDDTIRDVAYNHSLDMFETETFSHESEKYGQLADRLARRNIFFESAGENIAYQYTDSIAVVSGWLNSKGHRETLLSKKFTHIGVGVYKKYYTQNFLEKSWE